jgi:hypothetical protein
MSYESTAEPIKVGYLFDLKLPANSPQEKRDELMRPFELVFNDALAHYGPSSASGTTPMPSGRR